MKKILIISDTHSYIDQSIIKYVKQADEVWHAGDIGNIKILTEIEKFSKIKSVYGNIDDHVIRSVSPETNSFFCEKIKVSMIHIAGNPPYFNKKTKKIIETEKPNILVYGHSHILKVKYYRENKVLLINLITLITYLLLRILLLRAPRIELSQIIIQRLVLNPILMMA